MGVSTHSLKQVREAARSSADYLAVGPVYATQTKAEADPVVGLELVRQARAATRKPLVAIGGITLERYADVLAAGADCAAVAGDILGHADPVGRARQYLQSAG
jgi:thiamine-phosphate pyrophosphorylase